MPVPKALYDVIAVVIVLSGITLLTVAYTCIWLIDGILAKFK